ncbi:DASS family sodium-coupled anion symporter [Actinomyces lilanjuaniae]|uniref:Sodium-dependent dicarboxylate transporter SdcS n=1 Tax=Actinomyces lilanjuaniae TaxID=2321394 RepID=A0ABN5PQG3_9ACTO|nr:DASS family sodium-coupled anion symporter [Actinomyces lilanjuaniae]AYD90627.1 DASS family sodium-coupled anion symporter [Actinomyces lilanjuaniae]
MSPTTAPSSPVPASSKHPPEHPAPRLAQRRRSIGVVLGLALAVLTYIAFPSSAIDQVNATAVASGEEAAFTDTGLRTVAAAAVLLGLWWMTEAIPLAATALLPLVIFPALQVADFEEVAAPYASDTIFLFMGGFMLALTMQRWNLHRRIALRVVLWVGTRPRSLVLGFMVATGFLSMWVSNTATAVLMLPIGASVLGLVSSLAGGRQRIRRFSTALMLAIAYAASIGSVGTIIGTPPNALLVAYLSETHGVEIGFGQWMLVGVPLAAVLMVVAWWLLVYVLLPPEIDTVPGGREVIEEEWRRLGPMSGGEVRVSIVFLAAAASWVLVPTLLERTGAALNISDALIAMATAAILFLLPGDRAQGTRLLDWATAKEVPWDVLLLFGGGLSLSSMFSRLGLSIWIGEQARGLEVLPTVLFVAAVALLVIVLTELTSNTATAAAFLPIMGGVAVGIGLTQQEPANVLLLTAPVALSATFAFMLPVATPPNAVAYGSGYVRLADMVRSGVWLNIIGMVLVTLAVMGLVVPVFGLSL